MVKNLPPNARDGVDGPSIPGSERPPGRGHGNLLEYSCLGKKESLVGCSPWGHKESDMTD